MVQVSTAQFVVRDIERTVQARPCYDYTTLVDEAGSLPGMLVPASLLEYLSWSTAGMLFLKVLNANIGFSQLMYPPCLVDTIDLTVFCRRRSVKTGTLTL